MAVTVDIPAAQDLCQELPLIRDRLFRAGLFKTGHALEAAVQAIGYETADAIIKAEKELKNG